MKKVLVVSTLLATSLICTGETRAAASKEENIGFASGALAGAAIGGPIGFIIGGATGIIMGGQVEKANQLDKIQKNLALTTQRETQLKEEITMLQQNLNFDNTKKADVKWVTEGLTLNLMFTTNSSELSDTDYDNIKQISSILFQFPKLSLQLDGYTDPRGSEAENLILSQQRVNQVKQAFESFDVNPDRIIGVAHGEMANMSTENSIDSYALARKVSVNFVPQSHQQLAQNEF